MKNMITTKKKTIIIAVALCMLLVSGLVLSKLLGVSFAKNDIKDGDEIKSGNAIYEVINHNNLLVEYMHPIKKTATVSIPDVIKAKGETLKVASIKYDAFKGNKKVKKITIGSRVVYIGEKAFYGCKNLKDITISALNLNADGIQTKAFQGINSKAVIKVPEQRLSEYKKMLKARGVTGKNQQIKGVKMEEGEVPRVTFGPDHPLPEPEEAIASIGNIAKVATNSFNTAKVSDSAKYAKGDSIPFSARVCMHPEIYGQLHTRETYGKWKMCYQCKKFFSLIDDKEYAIHVCMSTEGCGIHHIFTEQKEKYTESYWVADYEPCKTAFHVTIPEGLSYQKDSIKLLRSKDAEIDNSEYSVEISGQELTVTIDDIKAMPYFGYSFETSEYGGFRYPVSILFNAEINDNIAAVNTVNASTSYSYKGLEKTIDLGSLSVYTSSLQFKNTNASGNAINGSKFTLYKQKKVYNNTNIATLQYFKVAEAESIDGLITFNGIGSGNYKLEQTEVSSGYKKMNSLIFVVSMKGENGNITSLSAKNQIGKKLSWDADSKTGVISATIVNQ